MTQSDIDDANRAFWDELCGSQLARSLGVTDDSVESLQRFDEWYFRFYPYLSKYIPFDELQGKRVLEVGLGYGTVAQRIAQSGSEYHGLDIAKGPVEMVRHRLRQNHASGELVQGSILEAPWPSSHFDVIIAIGCLHHTGNLAKAILEVQRLLKGGGVAIFMVYNATSYRQWLKAPIQTWQHCFGKSPMALGSSESMRSSYDRSLCGQSAPQTEFVTAAELESLCASFSKCTIARENIGKDSMFRLVPRPIALRLFGPTLGLDLYVTATK